MNNVIQGAIQTTRSPPSSSSDLDGPPVTMLSQEEIRQRYLQAVQVLLLSSLVGVTGGVLVGFWSTVVFAMIWCPTSFNPIWKIRPFNVFTTDDDMVGDLQKRNNIWYYSFRYQLFALLPYWFLMPSDQPIYYLVLFYPFELVSKYAVYRRLQGYERRTRVLLIQLNFLGNFKISTGLVIVITSFWSVFIGLVFGPAIIYPLLGCCFGYFLFTGHVVSHQSQHAAVITTRIWMLVLVYNVVLSSVPFVPKSVNAVPIYLWVGIMTTVLDETGLFGIDDDEGKQASLSSVEEEEEQEDDPEMASSITQENDTNECLEQALLE